VGYNSVANIMGLS